MILIKSILLQICFLIRSILRVTIFAFINLLIPRDKHIILIGCRKARKTDMFTFNTKYLFLNQSKIQDFKLVWLCDDKDIINELKQNGFKNIYARKSFQGIYYSLKAKYWITDNEIEGVNNTIFSTNAKTINVWHGIPLKKIENDIEGRKKYPKLISAIYNLLKKKEDFFIVNGQYEKERYKTAFLTDDNKIKILGSPRLDVIFNDINKSDIFMYKDFSKIKHFKEIGKKIIIYMPTFRDTGKDISGWLKSDKLKSFLKNNNAILICKLHFNDKAALSFEDSEELYKMDKDSDIYPVLKYSDALISDYSSIAFDYLLLDKPIIYHAPDLQEYQDTCRGFYMPYEEFAVGEITRNEEEILFAMKNVIDGVDNYKEQRKVLRDRMFKYQDGKNCERVVKWITSLDK